MLVIMVMVIIILRKKGIFQSQRDSMRSIFNSRLISLLTEILAVPENNKETIILKDIFLSIIILIFFN